MTTASFRQLGEVIEVKHGFAFDGQYFCDSGPYRLLTPGNFAESGGFFDRGDKQKHYDGPVPKDFVLAPGELLVAMTEQAEGLLGSSALVPSRGKPCLHNQRLGLVRPLPGADVDLRYLYYVFNTPSVRRQIRATASGAKVRHTAPSRIAAVSAYLPELPTQRRIASILGAYDDLIEVNRRRIAVLEEMARRLFEEWFVRVASEAAREDGEGPLPAGWSTRRLKELVQLDKGVSYSGEGLTLDGDPLVNLKNILAGGGFRTDGLKRYSGDVKPRHCVVPGDLVMANTDLTPSGGVIGNAALVPVIDRAERIALTHHLFAVRPLQDSPIGRQYLCHWLNSPRFKSYARGHANGATVLGLRADSVLAHPALVPPPLLAKRFEDFASSNYVLAQNLVRANQRLAACRDLLLPRLISGDLPVTAAERELEAVA